MAGFGVGLFLRFHQLAVRWIGDARVTIVASVLSIFVMWRTAGAEEALRVELPAECGSRDAFLSEVAALRRTDGAGLTVSEVVITRLEDRTYALRLVSAEGPRTLVDRDCLTLFKAAAVIVATMVRPDPEKSPAAVTAEPPDAAGDSGETVPAAGRQSSSSPPILPEAGKWPPPSPSGPPAALRPTGTAEAPSRDERRAPEPRDKPGPALQFALGGAGFVGLSPEPHLGIEALAGLSGTRWGAHLAARLLPPRSMIVRDELGLRETVWGMRLSASQRVIDWLRVSLGLSGYWISAQGLGITDPTTDSVALLAPELEVAASVLAQPAFRAEIGLQGRFGLTRPRFQVASGQVVYELPRLGGAVVLRILWTQP